MPLVNLHQKIRDILSHLAPLPTGADSPIQHFSLTSGDIDRTLDYLERKTELSASFPTVASRHLGRLRQMAIVSLIENLERFLKELAAECIDVLAPVTVDDRLDTFRVNGSAIAGHFGTDTLGRALCEAGTWLDCKTVNDRFRNLLSDASPTAPVLPIFTLFPQQPIDERARHDTLELVWQLRHTVVHNVGVITQSDAVKLRVLSKRSVMPLQTLIPTRTDIQYLIRFLDETAQWCNQRVGMRLAEILTRIHTEDPSLFDPVERATHLASKFQMRITVAGVTQSPPP